MRRVRSLLVAVALACAAASSVTVHEARADAADADPFKARLTQNLGIATRARATFDAQAKRKPPKGLSAEQRRGYAEQSRWLVQAAGRFGAIRARMEAAMAKTKGSAAEFVQLNVEFSALRDQTEAESQRFEPLAPACRARHAAALAALRG
jgi:hypothetical protein